MTNANITKKETKETYLSEDMEELEVNDREKLANAILGHGNLKKAIKGIGRTELTIKRAIMGFKVNPDTMERIQNYLQSLQEQS